MSDIETATSCLGSMVGVAFVQPRLPTPASEPTDKLPGGQGTSWADAAIQNSQMSHDEEPMEALRETQLSLYKLCVNLLYRQHAMEAAIRAMVRQHPDPDKLLETLQQINEFDAVDQLNREFPEDALEGLAVARKELLHLLRDGVTT